ncbi:MAG: alkyl hydroperoxide reductase [Dokdonella sp.]|uniref:alkyl hydroperoxide reductase n=1 Tax=Dokdonella sp. TaxID=2291710 RepID=UPI003263007C
MDVRNAAPPLPDEIEWVNTATPPRIADHRGRVVLLWFWSYDSVNCWNQIPDINRLAEKYHDGLTVIGIHSPKYPRQAASDAVLSAVNRLGLRHAVANDGEFRVWRSYAIRSWPSIALIDAAGALAAVYPGEGSGDLVDVRIGQLLDEAALNDLRVYEPTPPVLRPQPRTALAFPGKVLVDEKFLYIADSGHHRVLECSHEGTVSRSFGSGNAGHADGSASQSCFNDPQGLARWGSALYVADRGNHSVRRIDLGNGIVETVLGTGRAGFDRPENADARSTALNSPIDLSVIGHHLLIAVAGQNQIWKLDLLALTVVVYAGEGERGLLDGSAMEALFAQPSGLATIGRNLLVADAASSSIRWIEPGGRVETMVGTGLYDFGDAVGMRGKVRLQNPLAIATDARSAIYVADSGNNAIKRLERESGKAHLLDLLYGLNEPQGLAVHANQLWIANTNRHEIARVDLATGVVHRVGAGES